MRHSSQAPPFALDEQFASLSHRSHPRQVRPAIKRPEADERSIARRRLFNVVTCVIVANWFFRNIHIRSQRVRSTKPDDRFHFPKPTTMFRAQRIQ